MYRGLKNPAWLVRALFVLAVVAGVALPLSAGTNPAQATASHAPREILVLSNRADLISGGDALVEIKFRSPSHAHTARIELNGDNVKPAFGWRNGRYIGLVTGLQNGDDNVLTARVGHAGKRITITNHPITGPIVSGPHLTPYECRLTQNDLVPTGDAHCSAVTTVQHFYRASDNTFKPLVDPFSRPPDLVNTTTNDGNTVPYIVRVESGTINRGVYRLAILDDPVAGADFTPGPGWNKKLVVAFGCCGSAQYNQGVQGATSVLSHRELSRGFAFLNSTELINQQHANPHLQGETLMMLKEYFTEHIGIPKWTVGTGGSGGAIQQYVIAQLFPGLLDGLQPSVSFPETAMPDVWECRLLNRVYAANPAQWPLAKQTAVNGFNSAGVGFLATTCVTWDVSFASAIKADNAPGCGVIEPANVANIYHPVTNPFSTLRCDVLQTNANLLGTDSRGFARRPLDNIGVQYGLGALRRGDITPADFLDLNERIGGYNGDGNPQAARMTADLGALRRTYEDGLKNGFNGPGLANVPIITQRTNADARSDIHDTLQDLIIRARLRHANDRADNQIIWASGSTSGFDMASSSLDTINEWLDNIADDPGRPSTRKVVRNKPPLATDSCWDLSGNRIIEPASTDPTDACNVVYPRFSTPRLQAGAPLIHDVLKCQRRSIRLSDYPPGAFSSADLARLHAIYPSGVCDWSRRSVGQVPAEQWTTWEGGPGFDPLGPPPVSHPIGHHDDDDDDDD